jgi:methionyl aminopeptidase
VHGDTNATFLAGNVDEESRLLVERTEEAMMRGIRAVAPGRPLNAIGRVIESYARRFGYGVVRDFTGHGIGTNFHSGLIVPHFDDPDDRRDHGAGDDLHDRADAHPRHDRLRRLAGWLDGRDRDGRRTAQFEHTLLVTADGYEILTLP